MSHLIDQGFSALSFPKEKSLSKRRKKKKQKRDHGEATKEQRRAAKEEASRWNSQVTAVSFDALGGAEAFAVVGVAHAGVAVALAGWKRETGKRVEKVKSRQTVFCGGGPEPCGSWGSHKTSASLIRANLTGGDQQAANNSHKQPEKGPLHRFAVSNVD